MARDEAGSGIPCCWRGQQSHPHPSKPLSWLHRWQPLPKVLGLMALMAAFASVRCLALLPLIWALVAGLWSLSGLPWSLGLRRLAAPGLLVAGLMGILPFWAGETILWRWGSLALRWEGLQMALRIGGRGLALFALTMLLLETTPHIGTVGSFAGPGDPRPPAGTGLAHPALFAGSGRSVAADATGSPAEGLATAGIPVASWAVSKTRSALSGRFGGHPVGSQLRALAEGLSGFAPAGLWTSASVSDGGWQGSLQLGGHRVGRGYSSIAPQR